jgi:two-component system, OmpR family, KDP operon response regulator KdpE
MIQGTGHLKHICGEESRVWRFIQAGDFRIDPEAFGVSIGSRTVHLTPKEFKLLLYLAKRTARAVTHQRLIQAIWGVKTSGERERLRVLVQQLRKKIEVPGGPRYLVTEPWIGYRFEPAGEISSLRQTKSEIQATDPAPKPWAGSPRP